jgi:hypothetical protein
MWEEAKLRLWLQSQIMYHLEVLGLLPFFALLTQS